MFPAGAATASPASAQITAGTMTVNRTLLHAQAATSNGTTGGTLIPSSGRNGTTHGLRGLASYSGDESPPPDYNVVVHDNRHGFFILYIDFMIFQFSVQADFGFPLLFREATLRCLLSS